MKLQNYSDQIRDIFKANKDQENSDEESDDEEVKGLPVQVRVSKLTKVIKDMGLLCGIVFTTWEDYISGSNEKKTKKEIVEKIKRVMWKDTHLGICIQTLEQKGKKAGDSILKKGEMEVNAGEDKKDEKEDGDKPQEEPSKEEDKKEEISKDKEEEKGGEKQEEKKQENDQTENLENTEKPDKTEKEDGSHSSHSERPETSKSATTKKTKTVAEEGKTETKTQNNDQEDENNRDRKVLFEEESYQLENRHNYIEVNTFVALLRQFFDEEEEIVVFDHLHEYDDEITEAFRAATDINYDPFLEKLKKTLDQYESALIKGDFKDEKEREATEGLVKDIRNQIAKITQSRIQSNASDRESKKKPITIEELRKRGLRELFTFYSKQHLPEGLEFGDIMNKLEVIDLGEFCIFARDFDLKIPKKKMIELFKKTSDLRHQPLNFRQFVEVLDKIGVAMNEQRIKDIKKRLDKLNKIETEQEPKPAPEPKEPSDKASENEAEGEGEGEKDDKDTPQNPAEESKDAPQEENTEKVSEKDEVNSKHEEKTSQKGSENSDSESKSKVGKTNGITETKSLNTQSKNVKFSTKDGETSAKNADSDASSESEEEINPIKIERKKLEKDLEKYENYGYKETHDEIMGYLEVHDHEKYRAKAKGVQVVPFFMKGKYNKQLKPLSQQGYSISSTDGMSERKGLSIKGLRK